MDAKQACDKLNGFNFQSRYLVGALTLNISRQNISTSPVDTSNPWCHRYVHILTDILDFAVLYHQPEKMVKSKEDIEARRESLAQLKKQHGID